MKRISLNVKSIKDMSAQDADYYGIAVSVDDMEADIPGKAIEFVNGIKMWISDDTVNESDIVVNESN